MGRLSPEFATKPILGPSKGPGEEVALDFPWDISVTSWLQSFLCPRLWSSEDHEASGVFSGAGCAGSLAAFIPSNVCRFSLATMVFGLL